MATTSLPRIAAHAARVGHVQIADSPGRNEPGTGTLDIAGHLAALTAAGYDGYVGLEYKPSGSTLDSFGWLPRERARSPIRDRDRTAPTTYALRRHQ